MSDLAGRMPLRADAERNRQRIVDAACELFGRLGLDVPLEDVARHAGVGIATLYRRFPTRSELAAAAFARKIADYVAVVDAALAEGDPWQAVVCLVDGLCRLQASDAGLRDLLATSFPDMPATDELMARAQAKADLILERARRAGVLRADARSEDLVLMALANSKIAERTHALAPAASPRFAGLMLAALRDRADGEPLPPAPTSDDLRAALKR